MPELKENFKDYLRSGGLTLAFFIVFLVWAMITKCN